MSNLMSSDIDEGQLDEGTKKVLLEEYSETIPGGVIQSSNIKEMKLLDNLSSKAAVLAMRDNNLRLFQHFGRVPLVVSTPTK